MSTTMFRWIAIGCCSAVLSLAAEPAWAQDPPATTEPSDVANEYRITAFPSYRISDRWSGFGYLG